MLKIGDTVPAGTLYEYVEVEGNGCSIGPNSFDIEKSTAGKKIAIFALPGAYTPTCSAKHVPGYVEKADALKAAGVDEIWCVSVNDAFVMGAWGREQKTGGKVRMMADGSADFAKATGMRCRAGPPSRSDRSGPFIGTRRSSAGRAGCSCWRHSSPTCATAPARASSRRGRRRRRPARRRRRRARCRWRQRRRRR